MRTWKFCLSVISTKLLMGWYTLSIFFLFSVYDWLNSLALHSFLDTPSINWPHHEKVRNCHALHYQGQWRWAYHRLCTESMTSQDFILTPKEVLGYNSCCLYMSRDDMHHQLRLETCRVLEWGKFSNCGVFYWTLFLHINDFTCLYCWFGYTSFLSLAYWTHLFELDTFSDKPLINMLTFNSILYYYNI